MEMDRDLNASINIKKRFLKKDTVRGTEINACGALGETKGHDEWRHDQPKNMAFT